MGIDIDGKMMVGKEYSDIDFGERTKDEIHEFIEEFLDYASPWFDADMEYWFIGKDIPDTPMENMSEFLWKCKKAQETLEPLIGKDLMIWGGQNVW